MLRFDPPGPGFARLQPHSLCCSGRAGARLIAQASRPCGCQAACLASKRCDFFSFDGSKGECRACRLLSICNASNALDGKNIRDMHQLTSQMLTSTWSKKAAPAPPAQGQSLYQASSSILPSVACPDSLNPARWKARIDPMAAAALLPNNSMAHFVGTDRSATKREATPTHERPRCRAHDEHESTQTEGGLFHSTCRTRITMFNAHLRRSRERRRALLIESPGKSIWGWGNVLPFVYALHLLCLRAERYCYLSLQDQDFGDRLGYANGEQWQADPSAIHQQFAADSKKDLNLSTAAWSHLPCWRNGAALNFEPSQPSLARSKKLYPKLATYSRRACMARLRDPLAALDLDQLADRLRLDATSLVHVRLDNPHEAYHTFESWFSFDLPLNAADGRLDRCLCRYVTQPLFLSRLPAPLLEAVRRVEARPPSLALHLRTMANHLPRRIRTSPACDGSTASTAGGGLGAAPWRRWLFTACREQDFRQSEPGAEPYYIFAMSDSPRLLVHLAQNFPRRVVISPMINSTASAMEQKHMDEDAAPYFATLQPIAGGSTAAQRKRARQRLTQWARAQQLLSLDFHLASLASEIQTDQESSFALPLMARSLCVRRVSFLSKTGAHGRNDSLCPNWTTTFPRTLPHVLYRKPWHFHSCFERSATTNHPCKGRSPEECHASFIAAV